MINYRKIFGGWSLDTHVHSNHLSLKNQFWHMHIIMIRLNSYYTPPEVQELSQTREQDQQLPKKADVIWSCIFFWLYIFFPHFYHSKVIYQYPKQVGSRFTTHTTKYECPFPCKLGIWYKHTHISFDFEYAVKQIIAGLELVTSGLLLMFLQKPAEAH